MEDIQPVPVTLITGFLGSGKTTLLNRALSNIEDMRFAVIENEFGAINIDHELVIRQEGEIVEMSNGCVCCSIRSDLVKNLDRLMEKRDSFDAILIETTGMAMPAPILSIFEDVEKPYYLNHAITLVDAMNFEDNLEKGDEAMAQICCSDILIVNKMDKINEAATENIEQRLAQLNPLAHKVYTSHSDVDLRIFTHEMRLNIDALSRAPLPSFQHKGTVSSCALESHVPLNGDALNEWLASLLDLPGFELFRIKGLIDLESEKQPLVIQGVGCSLEIDRDHTWDGRTPSSRLVIIGKGLDESVLRNGFKACQSKPF